MGVCGVRWLWYGFGMGDCACRSWKHGWRDLRSKACGRVRCTTRCDVRDVRLWSLVMVCNGRTMALKVHCETRCLLSCGQGSRRLTIHGSSFVSGQAAAHRWQAYDVSNSNTSSAVACCCLQVIPELNGKLTGMAFRVPTQVRARSWLWRDTRHSCQHTC